MSVELLDLMALADSMEASDVHLAPDRQPALRIKSDVIRLDQYEALTAEESERLLYSILNDEQRLKLDQNLEIDLSYSLQLPEHLVRFRINMFRQNRGLAAVFRLIPDEIKTPEEISLEKSVLDLIKQPNGLVLVTGPTGCGKTTTLATMIDQINRNYPCHILTIEDPIEFVYSEKRAVISQREVDEHTHSFANALRSALREDPDVILVGEMRDFETIELALRAAETGHLVFATLHTTDAPQTIDRIIDVFPAERQGMVRTQLGNVLKAVICQKLLKTADGKGRVAAREILLATPAVCNLIRENKIHLIYDAMSGGISRGMCPLEWALAEKVQQGLITHDAAMEHANMPKTLTSYLEGALGSLKTTPKQPAFSEPTPPQPTQGQKKRFPWG